MVGMIPFGNNPIFRYLLGWTLPPKYSFVKFLRQKVIRSLAEDELKIFVLQDFLIDIKRLKQSLEFFDKTVKIYPAWLCPTRNPLPDSVDGFTTFNMEDDIYVDIGLYGLEFKACQAQNKAF